MRRIQWTMLPTAVFVIALLASGSVAWGAQPGTAFTASSGLFELIVPDDWVAEEHVDGGGVRITSSSGASVNVTFIPRSVLHSGGLRMGAPAGAGPMAIAERIAILLPPTQGVEAAEPALLELASGAQAVELAAESPDLEGALYILEPAPGVATLASATAAVGTYTDVRDIALELLASMTFSGDEEALMRLLDPPPLVDIALG